ncbi:hypothetical protein K2Z83_20790 [Oscillochloris sp. ZM17-4]|uniref:hypothetical protein n=1 Tax=Oscillochloris sp. ZM17-4 TaxID=2866714 RepID=UPI001C72BFD3|nr:hypothetical protein [Oscillochloris sp. ZM17-4]MBX0330109.1 hypothetical protein [Oscillochloris sp. ZM17-4]
MIALPCIGKLPAPPLALAYIATLLEQRRHIVRIYDLALDPESPLSAAFQPLRSFRPQVLVVAGEQPEMLAAAVEALHEDQHLHVLPVQMSRGSLDANQICSGVIQWIDRQRGGPAGPVAPPAEISSIDDLPFPARHLLSLESYDMRAIGGELQTIVLVAGLDPSGGGKIALRSPMQIVAELRSVSHEFGLRHYLFPDVSITADRAWLVELLTRLCDAGLNIGWEASADADQLDEALSAHMARAGCEAITLHLRAASVFESVDVRGRVRQAVTTARNQGVFVRAHVRLEPPYESVPQLVDVAATFNLDDVRFEVVHAGAAGEPGDGTQVKELARQMYDAGRDRQRFINRFGPALGNLIWKLSGQRGAQSDT